MSPASETEIRHVRQDRTRHAAAIMVALLAVSFVAWFPAGSNAGVAPAGDRPENREDRWFPVQAAPKGVVRTDASEPLSGTSGAQMLLQSVAGLAARAVTEGRSDEMVWVATGNTDLERWYARTLGRRAAPEFRGVFRCWDLVDRYRERGLIKGYILYRSDRSSGQINEHRPGMDLSVNVATSLAGLLDGVIVEEGLEAQAREHGLKLLTDARDKRQRWCFETYRTQFNRRVLCTQDPRKPNVRDLAIASKALTIYGPSEPLKDALKWLEPPSPILGWNGGDEFETTKLSTVQGHFQTATDWCMNLPVLMAGSDEAPPARARGFDPRTIDWADARSAVSFVSTDGDNVQWLEGNFFGDRNFWGSPDRGRIPFGWSTCFAHLAQLCPTAQGYAAETQGPNDHFLEWGGGYYYPDLFARDRPDRWALLARHARRTWDRMKDNSTPVIGFNVFDPDSDDARKALEVFAGETDGMLGILVFRYSPYEGGAGKVTWVKDRRKVDLPVVAARYSIWEHTNERPRSGTPARVAKEIRDTVNATPGTDLPRYDWAVAHVWSYFRRAPGADEARENMRQEGAEAHGGIRGYSPAVWCAERLPSEIRVVSPEEMTWRIRMKHDPAQTRAAIGAVRP